ncbi:MAG: PKD domain-containing protein, partial [Verrucomicrobiales bacterium]
APLSWNAVALESTNDNQALTFALFDLTDYTPLLHDGENILAIHAMNSTLTSSDFLLVPELEAGVTTGGISLTSPRSSEISMPLNTALKLFTLTNGAVAGGEVTWTVLEGDPNAALLASVSPNESTVIFTTAGTIILRGTTTVNNITETTDILIQVGSTEGAVGAAIDVGEDKSITELSTTLVATVTPSDLDRLQWRQLSGPARAVFSDPVNPTTQVGMIDSGTYRFRLEVTRNGITTFNE